MKIRSLGRYEVRGELGRGTMGVVYLGYDPVLDREIALKTIVFPESLSPERRKKFLDRFFLEAKIAGKLIHPNIVVTHDAATDDDTEIPFIAMEHITGASLHDRVRDGALDWREALALIEPLANALDHAHQQGVVHRDIKPANVLLTAKSVPKIADFGIAKLPNGELTQTGTVVGTPYFMSPEQLRGDDVDGRSDLFSLGALLYNLLTGTPPFRGADLANITQQVLYKSPKAPSELDDRIPSDVDGVLARAMAKEVEVRYRNGEELATDLARVRHGEAPLRALALGEKTQESVPAAPTTLVDDRAVELVPEASPGRYGVLVGLLIASVLTGLVAFRWDDVSRWVIAPIEDELREDARRAGVRSQATATRSAAAQAFEDGELDRAFAATEEALVLSRDASDGDGEARSLLWRGRVRAERGEWSEARADFEAAGAVFEIYEVPDGKAAALVALGDLERDLGRFDVAESYYDGAGVDVDTTLSRAWLALFRGDLEAAEDGFERAGAWAHAGAVAASRGELDTAERLWSRAEDSPELARFRGNVEELGVVSDTDEPGTSLLRTMFRHVPTTPRGEARLERLP